MKVKTRIISVLMIMMMVFTGMSFSSYAATPTKGTVYVSVTQDNAKAQKILTQVNKQRAKRGLRKITLDKGLTTAAVQRAAEISMVIPTTSPHRRPDGRYAKTVHSRATRENCAEGYFTGPLAVVNTWMNSKGHKATILLKSARSCGIAYVNNPADEETGYYVLIMSNSKAKTKLTSTKKVTSTKTVVALAKYLKAGYFFPEAGRTKIGPSDTTTIKTYYAGPKTLDFTAPLIQAKSFTWTSSNKNVATVSTTGKVTAIAPGTVTIKAKLKKGPSIVKSIKLTVTTPEENFDKLTNYVISKGYLYEEGEGYEPGSAYLASYYGYKMMNEEDQETGEEVFDHNGSYVVVQEDRQGEELAFLTSYDHVVGDVVKNMERTFMIVSMKDGKIDDTLTFIHDFVDEDYNCLFKLKATAPRDAVDIYNLQWEVVENNSGAEIDDELISDQLYDIFFSDTFYYLYNRTGVKLKHLGIKQV